MRGTTHKKNISSHKKKPPFHTRLLVSLITIGILWFGISLILWSQKQNADSFYWMWILSFLLSASGIGMFLYSTFKRPGSSMKNKLVYPTVLLVLGIWVIRYAVALNIQVIDDGESMNWFEHLFDAMVHSLQTFSMDEDYTTYLVQGKVFLNKIGGPLLPQLYGVYVSVLNLLAPIAGGAILLDVLSNVFPTIQLVIYRIFARNRKYVLFSELNEMSIAIAESYAKSEKVFFVFTDVFGTDDERMSELLARARKLHAVCLSDDILEIRIYGRKATEYYLIDKAEENNIHALAMLYADNSVKTLWELSEKVDIYLFASDSAADALAENLNSQLESPLPHVTIKVVREYENLVYSLLQNQPLYLPLLETKASSLSVLLIGGGKIGHQFFKHVYWCGQMLNPAAASQPPEHPNMVSLKMTVISQRADHFRKKMKLEMPEAFEEGLCTENGESDSTTLPYADFSFLNADVTSSDFLDALEKAGDIDYVLIALGDDKLNISTCEIVQKFINRKSLCSGKPAYIHLVIENDHLKDSIGTISRTRAGYVHINAFGGLQDRYHYRNIHTTALENDALLIHKTHNPDDKERNLITNLYNFRSSIASALHFQYKLFSVGMLSPQNPLPNDTILQNFAQYLMDISHADLLLWCEKRRWNAYTRSTGFVHPTTRQLLAFYRNQGNIKLHKAAVAGSPAQNLFNFHACLVECPAATGITLTNKQLVNAHKTLTNALQTLFSGKLPDGTACSWEDFCQTHPTLEEFFCWASELLSLDRKTYDDLDFMSIFANSEYKDYDYNQTVTLAITKIGSALQSEELSAEEKEQVRTQLSALRESCAEHLKNVVLEKGSKQISSLLLMMCCITAMLSAVPEKKCWDFGVIDGKHYALYMGISESDLSKTEKLSIVEAGEKSGIPYGLVTENTLV